MRDNLVSVVTQPSTRHYWKRRKKLYCIGSKTELGSHTTKMEQSRRQIREMWAVYAHYPQVELLWTSLRAEMEEDIKTRHDNLDADNAKRDVDREEKEGRHESF
jgi:hypothetical protein